MLKRKINIVPVVYRFKINEATSKFNLNYIQLIVGKYELNGNFIFECEKKFGSRDASDVTMLHAT